MITGPGTMIVPHRIAWTIKAPSVLIRALPILKLKEMRLTSPIKPFTSAAITQKTRPQESVHQSASASRRGDSIGDDTAHRVRDQAPLRWINLRLERKCKP